MRNANSIYLTESQLKSFISESIMRVLMEIYSRREARSMGKRAGEVYNDGADKDYLNMRQRFYDELESDEYDQETRNRLRRDFDKGANDLIDLDYAERGLGYYRKVPGTNVSRDETGLPHKLMHKMRMKYRDWALRNK